MFGTATSITAGTKKKKLPHWDDIPLVSYTWQNTSSTFSFTHSATAVRGVRSAEIPATTRPRAQLELLAPVHKHDFRRGLMDASLRDTVLQMNHSCPIPQGSVQKGINIQNHHSRCMDNVPVKHSSARDTLQMTLFPVSRSNLISKWTKQMHSPKDTAYLHIPNVIWKDKFLYAGSEF